jgi:hypothetical protein
VKTETNNAAPLLRKAVGHVPDKCDGLGLRNRRTAFVVCADTVALTKTSCAISGLTSTTIARIPHGKGEHPIRRRHDQSQISARLDGSPIVDPYFRPQWLPNFSNIRAHCGIRSGLQKPGMKSCGVCALGCSAFRDSDRFTVTKWRIVLTGDGPRFMALWSFGDSHKRSKSRNPEEP